MAKTVGTTEDRDQSMRESHEGAGLHVHTRTLHPSLKIPYITRGDMAYTAKAATSRVPGGMPSTKDLVFYGGLGAMTVAGALEWPVALAVGGATYLLRGGRTRKAGDKTTERNAGSPAAVGKM
ncbi:hypothetical protein ACWGQ5_31965 [Streptomyces sp. NPDC055722]